MSEGARKIEAARSAALRLEQLGEPFHAEAVNSLCRSNSALIETCRRMREELIAEREGERVRVQRLRREWGLDREASQRAVIATKTDVK